MKQYKLYFLVLVVVLVISACWAPTMPVPSPVYPHNQDALQADIGIGLTAALFGFISLILVTGSINILDERRRKIVVLTTTALLLGIIGAAIFAMLTN